jgi:uncharacterized protein (TIGR03435 family)
MTWNCIRIAIVSLLLFSPQQLTFDVATVKSTSGRLPNGAIRVGAAPIGNPAAGSAGRVYYDRVSLRSIMLVAFSLKDTQLISPDWMASEYYEIDARMPVATTPEQIKTMLQNLLVERFKMKIHRETRETDAYRLVVAKGSKLKEAEPPENNGVTAPSPPSPPKRDADGWLIAPPRPGLFQDNRSDRSRWTFRQSRVAVLAAALENRFRQPVSDATSLTGYYDFMLTFSAEGLPTLLDPLGFPIEPPIGVVPKPLELPNIFTGLDQLGLKLERTKGSIDLLIIDQAEKTPIAN